MIWNKIQVKLRSLFFVIFRSGKVKRDISIFCNNCIGAFVAHDYNLPFNSPTVNLMIPPSEFIEYIKHLDIYKDAKIEDISGGPEGLLDNKIHINFIHYKTFLSGVNAWEKNKANKYI